MKTIEIRTTQNVTIEYELASLWERFLAFLIDALVIFVIYMILSGLVLNSLMEGMEDTMWVLSVIVALPMILFIFYQLLSEVMADGQSWGKKAMGIKVVRLDGQEPGLSDYLLRAVFHFVDTFLSLTSLAALFISSTAQRQRLGDMTANTSVVRIKFSLRFQLEDILKINSLQDYEPEYPEVRRLSEQDMLLIKNIISRYRKYKNEAHQEVVDQLVDKIRHQLDIVEVPRDKIAFLKTLIRDYIVLTR